MVKVKLSVCVFSSTPHCEDVWWCEFVVPRILNVHTCEHSVSCYCRFSPLEIVPATNWQGVRVDRGALPTNIPRVYSRPAHTLGSVLSYVGSLLNMGMNL
jgi:hypothetical protein